MLSWLPLLASSHVLGKIGGGCAPSSRCAAPRAQAVSTSMSTIDAAKLFGRLAEQTLYLDERVGACCHSACSDCEWRLPDGGYRFDILKSSVPKWIPCYLRRDFGDERGCHIPVWSSALFPDADVSTLSRAEFDERLHGLPYNSAMGPKGTVKEPALSEELLDSLWSWLNQDAADAMSIEASTFVRRLQDLSLAEDRDGVIGEGPDSLVWKEFAKGLGAAPFERF